MTDGRCRFVYDVARAILPPNGPDQRPFPHLGIMHRDGDALVPGPVRVSPVTGTLLTELKVNKEELGRTIFFAFFFAYALLQVPAGWLSDTFGARRMLAVYVAVWSLATMYMGFVNGLTAIFMVRFLLGISQAGAYPTAASLLKRWFPYGARGRANSSVSMGGRRGGLHRFRDHTGTHAPGRTLVRMGNGALACGVCPYGALGLGWVVIFVALYRDSPRQHPWCNPEEAELIEPSGTFAAGTSMTASPRTIFPPLSMLTSKEPLLMCVIGFCVDIGWVFLVSWLPLYLVEKYGDYLQHNVGDQQVVSGLMTAVTGLAGMTGTVLGGLATDSLVVRFGPVWGRRLPGVIAGVLVAAIYLVAPHLPNVWWFVTAMAAISLSIDFCLGSMWATYQDIGGRHVASVLGFGNMCTVSARPHLRGTAAAWPTATNGIRSSHSPPGP